MLVAPGKADKIASSCAYDVLTGMGTSVKTQDDGSKVENTVSVEGRVGPFAECDAATAFSACED